MHVTAHILRAVPWSLRNGPLSTRDRGTMETTLLHMGDSRSYGGPFGGNLEKVFCLGSRVQDLGFVGQPDT